VPIYFNPCRRGIVADSNPEAEYEETLAKARGFFAALKLEPTFISGKCNDSAAIAHPGQWPRCE
jgi:hypothetical protein